MSLTSPVAPDLGSRITGTVLERGDDGFDDACLVWNRSFVHRPQVVVIPADAHDVAAAVTYAAHHHLGVTVQSTGHGIVAAAAGGMLILTYRLDEVTIDGDAWTARIGGGAKWEKVIGPSQDAGLAPLLGSTLDVGAVGYTLGGGMGWLGRKYGLSIDRVRSFELVTADGQIRTATAESDPELFWALRGAGAGSLGVITAMEIDLVPVTDVYAGNLFYPAEQIGEIAARYRAWIEQAPDELTSSLVMMNFPPLDEVPEFLRGRSFAIVRGCVVGADDRGAALLEHWRDWRAPEFDLWGPMSFRDVASVSNDPVDPMSAMSTSEWLTDLEDEVIRVLAHRVFPSDGPPTLVFGEIRHAGGAIARGSEGCYGNRPQRHLLQMVGIAEDEASFHRLVRYLADLRSELAEHSTGGVYLNFLEGEEKARRAPAGFDGDTWSRLEAVKATVDPDNLFANGLPLSGRDPQ